MVFKNPRAIIEGVLSAFVIGDSIYEKSVDYYQFGFDFWVKNSLHIIPVSVIPCGAMGAGPSRYVENYGAMLQLTFRTLFL